MCPSDLVRRLVALPGLVLALATPTFAQQLTLDAAFPRQAARGQSTTIHLAVQTRDVVRRAEVSPTTGVTVTQVTQARPAEQSQGVAWWDVVVAVASDAMPGQRAFAVVTDAGRSTTVTVTIPERVPVVTAVAPVSVDARQTVEVRLTMAEGAALGVRPYVWFTAVCGGEPQVGAVRGRVRERTVEASLPLLQALGSGRASRCDLQTRVTDSSGLESNTSRTAIDITALPRTQAVAALPPRAATGEWTEMLDRENRFTATFPGDPVATDTTWTSQFGTVLPARAYVASSALGRYSVLAVDYGPIERLNTERSMSCPAGAETCQGIRDWGLGYWKNDIRGAVGFAAKQYLQRDVVVTDTMSNFADLVAGQELVLTSRADGSRTYVSIYMHDNRLVILEANVPKGGPPPTIFQQTVGWLDDKGNRIRYLFIYHNEPDVPPPAFRIR